MKDNFQAPKGTKRGDIWNRQKGRCFYCGTTMEPLPVRPHRQPTNPKHATLEHVVPLSRGGESHPDSGNVVYACLECNHRKGDKLIGELAESGKAAVC